MQSALRKALPDDLKPLVQSSYDLPQDLTPQQTTQMQDAYAQASRTVFIYMTPVIGLCLILCFLIKDGGLARKEEQKQERAEVQVEAPEQVFNREVHEKTCSSCSLIDEAPLEVSPVGEATEKTKTACCRQ